MTDWEDRWQAGDTFWDHGAAAPPLVSYLRHASIRGRVLVPGCGSGHDVRALAADGAEVLGLDVAPTAIAVASAAPRVGTEHYRTGDWLQDPPPGRFDWVVEHTCFCAIDPSRRSAYRAALDQALVPGGHFFGIFYLRPQAETGPPFGVRRDELDGLFGDLEQIAAWIPVEAFPGREGREEVRLYRKPG